MDTLFDILWSEHLIADIGDGIGLIAIDRVMLHERTGGVALKSLAAASRTVMAPRQAFAVMDHIVDTLPGRSDRTLMPTGTAFITETRAAARAAGIALFDLGDERQGICHVISPEQAIVLPGATLVRSEEHTPELQSPMRHSYAVFCLKKKKKQNYTDTNSCLKPNNSNKRKHNTYEQSYMST